MRSQALRRHTLSALASAALFGALATTAFAQKARDARESHVAPPQVGWPTNGGDWYNRRYSPLTQIDRSNVGKLKGVWRTRLGGSGVGTKYSGEAQPIVHDGVIFRSGTPTALAADDEVKRIYLGADFRLD